MQKKYSKETIDTHMQYYHVLGGENISKSYKKNTLKKRAQNKEKNLPASANTTKKRLRKLDGLDEMILNENLSTTDFSSEFLLVRNKYKEKCSPKAYSKCRKLLMRDLKKIT